jgi:hypothetical protein
MIEGIGGMGAIDQLACASLAALFSVGMLIASHVFVEYRSSRSPTIGVFQPISLLTDNARRSIGQGLAGGFDGVL